MQDALMSTNNWMGSTPAIDSLSISELTLPGTHNAGSDWRASYPFFGPPRHWLACQHDSFHAQLNLGSRALDIRLTHDQKGEGPKKFVMHHNGHRNSRTLENLITTSISSSTVTRMNSLFWIFTVLKETTSITTTSIK